MGGSSAMLMGSSGVRGHQMERKMKKPLMEKRRRARINRCLTELKHILLQASPHQRTKLEKADILEMTVNYLRAKNASDLQSARQHFVDGFNQCSNAALQFASGSSDSNWQMGLVSHLSSSLVDKLNHQSAAPQVVEAKQLPAASSGVVRPQPCLPLTLNIPSNHRPTVGHPQLLPTPPFLQETHARGGRTFSISSEDFGSPGSRSSSLTVTETASFSPCSNYSSSSSTCGDDNMQSAKEALVWRPW